MDKDGSSAMPQNPPFSSPDSSSEPVLTGTPASTPNFFANSIDPSSTPSSDSAAAPATSPSPVTPKSSNSDRARHLLGGRAKHDAQAAAPVAAAAGPSLMDNTPDFFRQAANANETVVTIGGDEPQRTGSKKKLFIVVGAAIGVLAIVLLVLLVPSMTSKKIASEDFLTNDDVEAVYKMESELRLTIDGGKSARSVIGDSYSETIHSGQQSLKKISDNLAKLAKNDKVDSKIKTAAGDLIKDISLVMPTYESIIKRYDDISNYVKNKSGSLESNYSNVDADELKQYLDKVIIAETYYTCMENKKDDCASVETIKATREMTSNSYLLSTAIMESMTTETFDDYKVNEKIYDIKAEIDKDNGEKK